MPILENKICLISANKEIELHVSSALKNSEFEKQFEYFTSIDKVSKSFELAFLFFSSINESNIDILKVFLSNHETTLVCIIADEIFPNEGKFIIKNGAFSYLNVEEINQNSILKTIYSGLNTLKISTQFDIALKVSKEKESNLRTILNNVEDAIILLNSELVILDYNLPAIEFFSQIGERYPEINAEILDYFKNEKQIKFWKELFIKVLEGQKKSFELNLNKEHTYKVFLHPVRNENGVIGISLNALNITEFIKTQKEKELREANLKSLIQNTYDPMWSIDKEYKLIAFNSANEDLASQYLGRPPVMGDSVLFESYSDELEKNWEKSYSRALKGERFEEEMVYNYVGGNLYIENEFNPIRNSKDELIGVTCFSRDITERRQQEEKNKEFASIVEFSNDAIIGFKIDGTIESWNPAATEMLGYKSYEAIGQKTKLLFSSEDYEKVTSEFVSFLKGAPTKQFSQKLISKNGEFIDGSFSFSLHRDKQGRVNKASAIIRDISEQLKAEKELIEQQHFIESITETSPSILYVYDFYQGKTIYINKRASELLGYNKEEIRGFEEGIYEVMHPDDKKGFLTNNRILLHSEQGTIVEQDYRVKHKNGKYIWLNARNTIFKRGSNGQVHQILGTARDISKQKQIAEELELLSLFAKHTLNFVIISNPDGFIEFVNESFTSHLGYTLEEIKGKRIEDVLSGPKTDLNTVEKIIYSKKNQKAISEEIIFHKKSGQSYWAAVYINPVFENYGNLKQYIQIQIDISARKQNEELTLKAKDLAEKNAKFKDEFLANMSHEIRTPINGIIGMIDILESTNLDDKQKYYVDTFKKSSNSLLEIINNILDLSKLEAGKMEIKEKDFELFKTLENTKRLYTPIADQKNIYLKIEKTLEVPRFIKTDENKLVQIVSNLLSNAIKFTKKGGVTISVSKSKNEQKLLFEIKDTGIGIDEENLSKLFEKFSQVDQSAAKKFGGTGLGLAISKELSYMLGGKIGVSSKIKHGSNFWFTIGYKKSNLTQSTYEETVQKNLKTKVDYHLNVLLVDDKFINREVASLMLEHFGCNVTTAENGEECLKIYPTQKFDLILMDIQMPVMDGIEATTILRKKHKNLPLIAAVSANAMEGDAEKYISAGMDDYLPKPITKESVNSLLDKHFYIKFENQKNETQKEVLNNELPILKTEILDSLQAMGSEDVLKSLFKSFLKDANELVGEINNHLKNKNYQELRKSNHTINGLSGTIGASKMNKICIDISKAIKEERFSDLDEIVANLNQINLELINHINTTVLNHP